MDSSGAESDQTEKLNVEAVEQEQAPPVSVPLKNMSESESDKPDAPEKEEHPQIIVCMTLDFNSIYLASYASFYRNQELVKVRILEILLHCTMLKKWSMSLQCQWKK